jgi:hypothetical protein
MTFIHNKVNELKNKTKNQEIQTAIKLVTPQIISSIQAVEPVKKALTNGRYMYVAVLCILAISNWLEGLVFLGIACLIFDIIFMGFHLFSQRFIKDSMMDVYSRSMILMSFEEAAKQCSSNSSE